MQHGKGEVNSYTDLPQIIKKIPNNNLILHLKKLEKEYFFKKKHKVSRKREIIKIRAIIK